MALESRMRGELVKALCPMHAIAVENGKAHPGTPDINYADGWIECKALRQWPKRESTIVRLDHPITKEQVIFIRDRAQVSVNVWVMLRCRREWFLFNGPDAFSSIGSSTRLELIRYAWHYWHDGLKNDELIEILRRANAKL